MMSVPTTKLLHALVTFYDLLGDLRKLSTKNTTKLENSSNRFLRLS